VKIIKNHPKSLDFRSESSNLGTTPRRFHFTERRLKTLRPPRAVKRIYYHDDEVRGLTIAVNRGGSKTFVLYRKVQGRPERIPLGPFPSVSVEEARKRAMRHNSAISSGKNPAAERRAVRDDMSLAELFDTFLTLHAKAKKRTWKDDEAMFRFYLSIWRTRRISEITRLDVIKLHAHIGRVHGKYTANRVIELLRAMFNRAKKDWGWTGDNPAAAIEAFKERPRKRFLKSEELPAFFKALAAELNGTIRDYILLSLLCGVRQKNALEMEWSEIDWKRATWLIPAHKAKADEDINIALTPVVLDILRNRNASSRRPWVFPGRGKTGHLVEPKTAWRRILKRAQITNLRIHDLRRTLGSWQAATGASLPIIGKSLGHESPEATKIYALLDLDPVRESVNRAQQAMLTAGGLAGLLGGVQ
jgi:integrase